MSLALSGYLLFLFLKLPEGEVEKQDIYKDKGVNAIGRILDYIENRNFHKIEECQSQKKICYECLIIKPKHSEHCNKCNVCVYYRHKHSFVFDRCIGQKNARVYLLFLFSMIITLKLFLMLSFQAFHPAEPGQRFFTHLFGGFFSLFDASKILFLFTVFICIILAFVFEEFLWLLMPVSRKVTVGEYKRSFLYKYLFKVK